MGSEGSPPTVLIVDDDERVADYMADALRADYDVRVAYDGETALATLEREPIDVVLLDRRMPGMSGDDVLDRIRSAGVDCRIAMVTAVEEDRASVEDAIEDYVVKPISPSELEATVERLNTIDEYDEIYQELSSKEVELNVLKHEKSTEELAESDQYASLKSEIVRLRNELDEIAEEIPEDARQH